MSRASSSTKTRRPTTKRSAPSGSRRVLATATKASASAEERCQNLLDAIRRHAAQIAELFYEIGAALRRISREKLYVALDYASFEELLKKERLMASSQAYKLIEIVETYRQPTERLLSLGSERAYALARYSAATEDADPAAEIVRAGVLTLDGKRRPLDELSAAEIEAATRAARRAGKRRTKGDAEAIAAERAARTAQARARKRVARARVAARRHDDGWWLAIEVPLEQIERLLPA